MASITVVDKYTHTERSADARSVVLDTPSIVAIGAAPEQLTHTARAGNDLHLTLDSTEITVTHFFSTDASALGHDLVFAGAEQLWHATIDPAGDTSWARLEGMQALLQPVAAESPAPMVSIDRVETLYDNGVSMDTPRKNALTSSATLLLSGKGEPNSMVTIVEKHSPSDVLAQTSTDALGNWSASITLEQMRPHELVAQMSAWDHVLTSVPVAVNMVMDASVITVIDSVDQGLVGYIGDFITGTVSDDSAPELRGQPVEAQQVESATIPAGNGWFAQIGAQAIDVSPAEGASMDAAADGEGVMRLGMIGLPGDAQHNVLPEDLHQNGEANQPAHHAPEAAISPDHTASATAPEANDEPWPTVTYGESDLGSRGFGEPPLSAEQFEALIAQAQAAWADEHAANDAYPDADLDAMPVEAGNNAELALSDLLAASPAVLPGSEGAAVDVTMADLPSGEADLLMQQSAALNLF